MQRINIIFFGSTNDSVIVLENLFQSQLLHGTLSICCVVTQPPRPVGRKQVLTPTPVEIWAKAHDRTVLSFPSDPEKPWLYADESQVVDALEPMKADLLVSACYGQKIPLESINAARLGGLNVHPSILPRWRGADPVPWAILTGDHQSGVTVVTLAQKFDDGRIIAQKKVPIKDTDTSDVLRMKLFTIGADLLIEVLSRYLNSPSSRHFQGHPLQKSSKQSKSSYARRLTRDDGFEPWEAIQHALIDAPEAKRIDRKFRAFMPWPGVWTKITTRDKQQETGIRNTRLKILACHLSPVTCCLNLDVVQLEGKNPVAWGEFTKGYQLPS